MGCADELCAARQHDTVAVRFGFDNF